MEKRHTTTVLQEMLREQICCLGRIVARHQVPDDVVWGIARGFGAIYQRLRRQAEVSSAGTEATPLPYRMVRHPGLNHLLERLEVEAALQVWAMRDGNESCSEAERQSRDHLAPRRNQLPQSLRPTVSTGSTQEDPRALCPRLPESAVPAGGTFYPGI